MNQPRISRLTIPSLSALGFHSPNAETDLKWLGWWNEEDVELLWTLSAAADRNLALNNLVRLVQALSEHAGETKRLDQLLHTDPAFRLRLFGVLGGSSVLGDHLVANPLQWRLLLEEFPTAVTMRQRMLEAVEATPARSICTTTSPVATVQASAADFEVDSNTLANAVARRIRGQATQKSASKPQEQAVEELHVANTAKEDCSTLGTYRAGIHGQAAELILKRTYRSLLMQIAAYDLAGTYPKSKKVSAGDPVAFQTITGALSDLADAALTAALAVAVSNVYGTQPVDTRLGIIAMGKCGARELNYVSDVDVIFVAEPAHASATRLASEFIRIGCRCFFEVDAALRPEGRHGALVRTLESHKSYYERWADTWEFQALLKSRPMTGDVALAQAYKDALSPMVWAASQRESFVDDVQAMRRRVLENVPTELKQRELKLGEGGLRDVEFAVQLLQLVHGRSDESIRTLATVEALQALIEAGYVGRDDGHTLIEAYEFLRLLEHRLQLQKVKRTHTLPPEEDEKTWRWLAKAAGVSGGEKNNVVLALHDLLRKHRRQISNLHKKLFYRPLLHAVVNMSVDTLKLSPEAATLQLAALGYKFPERAYEHLTALAVGHSRKAKIQAMLLPSLMEWLSSTADPDAGLLNYRKLSEAVYTNTWFLRMLRDEGIVGQRLMTILGNSPYASDLLISAPDVVKLLGDGASGPKLLDIPFEQVRSQLVKAAARQDNPEKAIAVARSLRRAELARIAAADLLGMLSVKEVCRSLSTIWDAVLAAALDAEIRAQSEGDTPPARLAVIGMGRLGGSELGYGSDADVMFVCEPTEGHSENDAVRWAIGVCDRMRARLSKPSGDPPLEVDLGLRPEGRSGAVVRTLESYRSYYERWGEVWEIQALLRANFIAGDPELGEAFLQMIDQFRYPEEGITQKTIREVRRMKARVDNERLPRGADRNTHTKLGRGALTDIEWTVQLLILMHAHKVPALHNTSTLECLDAIAEHNILALEQVTILREAWNTATKARNAIVLVRGKRTDQLPTPGPQLAAIAGAAGWKPQDNQEFLEHYLRLTRRARTVVDEVFWGEKLSTHDGE